MRRVIIVVIAIASCGLTLAAAPDFRVQREDTSHATLHFGGSGTRTLDLRTIEGAIHVTADPARDAVVTIQRTVRAEDDAAAVAGLADVRAELTDNAATIGVTVRDRNQVVCGESSNRRDNAWWDRPRYRVRVDLTARVPANTRVRLCAINGGEIEMTGVIGDFDVTNVNGPIALSGLRGSGRATTVNGAVTASFTAAPQSESLFKTINGSVTTTFPSDLSADLRLKTFHGGLFTDFDVHAVAATPLVDRSQGDGRVVYRSNAYTVVRAGSGGPQLTLETLNGDVRVLRASR